MVVAYRCGPEEDQWFSQSKDPSTYSTSGHSTMHILFLKPAILTQFGTVRRERDVVHLFVLMKKTIKAIKRLRYDHPTTDLYGGEILPFDKLSIFQVMLLIFKIRKGTNKAQFLLTLLVDVHHNDTNKRSRGDFYVDTS
jgi:hypothetical protein